MARWRSPLALIFLTVFIDLVGFGIVIPVLPLYAERFGASPLVIGMLLGSYSAMQCLFAPLLGRLSDRVGRRPVLLLSIMGTAIGFLMTGLARSLPLLFAARVIDGMTGGNISTAQAYIADVTPPAQRSRGMGLIGAAFGLGFIVGPAIGGLLGHLSLAAPFVFAAALAAANALAVYWFLPESLPIERRGAARPRASWGKLLSAAHGRELRIVVAAYFVTTVAFSLVTATYPLFTERRFGYGAMQNGTLFAMQGVLSAVVQGVFLGWLVRRAGERRLAVAGSVMLSLGLFALPMSGMEATLILVTAALAVGHGLIASPLNSLASQRADPVTHGRVLGMMQAAASLARIVGPVLGGWLLQADTVQLAAPFGRSPYWVGGAVMLIALALALQL